MTSFFGKLKDIIGGGTIDEGSFGIDLEPLPSNNLSPQDNSFNSFSEPESEKKSSSNHSRFVSSEKSSSKMEYTSPSYTNLDNNVSNDFPSNVIGMPGVSNMVNEVVVIEPHSFDEVPQVIQTLKEQRSVVLNLNVMEPEEAQRAVDFVAGGTYAIDGHQERIGESIFLFTPRNVKVSTVSGKSYKTTKDTVISSNNLGNSFSESIWDEDSLVNTHLAQ